MAYAPRRQRYTPTTGRYPALAPQTPCTAPRTLQRLLRSLAVLPLSTRLLGCSGAGRSGRQPAVRRSTTAPRRIRHSPTSRRVDLLPYPNVRYVCDVSRGLPFDNGSVEEIYSSHFLEHLADRDVLPFLRECHRVLRPGGTVELIVPDLPAILWRFLEQPEESRWGFPLQTIFGNQGNDGEFHKTGFSISRLAGLLGQAGFEVEACGNVWDHGVTSIRALARKPV